MKISSKHWHTYTCITIKMYVENIKLLCNKTYFDCTEKLQSIRFFQALQYLRKVCNHPALVMTSQHPEHDNIMAQLKQQNSSLHDIQHATKLLALK